MTDHQLSHLSMQDVVIMKLDEFIAIVTANPKLLALVTLFKANNDQIYVVAGLQSAINKGPTQNKKTAWIAAAKPGGIIAAAVRSFAQETNNNVLYQTVDFTYKGLLHTSTKEAIVDMTSIFNSASALPAGSLTDYNVTALDITNFQALINAFSDTTPLRKSILAGSSAATKELVTLFTSQRSLLKKMDNILTTFEIVKPDLFTQYFISRKIDDMGKTIQAVELILVPGAAEPIFTNKFAEGDTFTARSHSDVDAEIYVTDTPDTSPAATKIIILKAKTDLKLEYSKDFKGATGHNLVVHNPSSTDDLQVTVIIAHGKSASSAASPINFPKPFPTPSPA